MPLACIRFVNLLYNTYVTGIMTQYHKLKIISPEDPD